MLTQVPAEQKSFLTFNGFFTNINVELGQEGGQGGLVGYDMQEEDM